MSLRATARSVLAVLLAVTLLYLGNVIGELRERNRLNVAKAFSTIRAQEEMEAGNIYKAIRDLHFAKAYEPITGGTDGILGEAYLLSGQYCLAKSFLESYIAYLDKNGLANLESSHVDRYSTLASKATAACTHMRKGKVESDSTIR